MLELPTNNTPSRGNEFLLSHSSKLRIVFSHRLFSPSAVFESLLPESLPLDIASSRIFGLFSPELAPQLSLKINIDITKSNNSLVVFTGCIVLPFVTIHFVFLVSNNMLLPSLHGNKIHNMPDKRNCNEWNLYPCYSIILTASKLNKSYPAIISDPCLGMNVTKYFP